MCNFQLEESCWHSRFQILEHLDLKNLGGSIVVENCWVTPSFFLGLSERVVIHWAYLTEHHELLSVWIQSETIHQVPTWDWRKTLHEQGNSYPWPQISIMATVLWVAVAWSREGSFIEKFKGGPSKVAKQSSWHVQEPACIDVAGVWGNLGCDRIWENLGGLAAYEQKMRKARPWRKFRGRESVKSHRDFNSSLWVLYG